MIMQLDQVLGLVFVIGVPVALLICVAVLLASSLKNKPQVDLQFLTTDEYMREWMRSHGEAHHLDEVVKDIKKKGNPFGSFYAPIVVGTAKRFAKVGLTPNKVSLMSVLVTITIFYLVVIAGFYQASSDFIVRISYGTLLVPAGFLTLFSGVTDGVDGALATLTRTRTKSGAWADAVLDRIDDTLLLVSLALGGFMIVQTPTYMDFRWLVLANIFFIFLYEYQRAKHFELDMFRIKALIAERPVRILLESGAFFAFGVNSVLALIAHAIDPAMTTTGVYFSGIINWTMIVFNAIFFVIMILCTAIEFRYVWKELKKDDKEAKAKTNTQPEEGIET